MTGLVLPSYSKPRRRSIPNGPPYGYSSPRDTNVGATEIAAMSPTEWYRKGLGQTIVTGVSSWASSGSGAHAAVQATGGAQPLVQTDASLLFDGVDDFLNAGAIAFAAQPFTVAICFKPVTWVSGARIIDFTSGGTAATLFQGGVSPNIRVNFGAALTHNGIALGSYIALVVVLNGASSIIAVNGSETTGDAGTNAASGITIGAIQTPTNFANMQVMEVITFASALSQAQRNAVATYLGALAGVPL